MKGDRRGVAKAGSSGGLLAIGIMFLVLGLTMDDMGAFIGVGVVFMALAATRQSEGDDRETEADEEPD